MFVYPLAWGIPSIIRPCPLLLSSYVTADQFAEAPILTWYFPFQSFQSFSISCGIKSSFYPSSWPHGNLHFVIHFTFLWWQTEVYDLIHSAGQPCLLLPSGRLGKPKKEAARSLGSDSQAKHFLEMYFLY